MQVKVAPTIPRNPVSSFREIYPSPIPAGWVEGKPGIRYRVVMVLTDGGGNRIPPAFPGSAPGYAIAKNQLQKYWHSPRPVLFVTDFMRQPNDLLDPQNLNLPDRPGQPLLAIGSRKLYGNLAARKLWFVEPTRIEISYDDRLFTHKKTLRVWCVFASGTSVMRQKTKDQRSYDQRINKPAPNCALPMQP